MSTITINGERIEVPMPRLLSGDELRELAMQARSVGDLYTCAVCQIAIYGYPHIGTWDHLDARAKNTLHREYLASDGCSWYREKAQLEMMQRALAGAP